MSDDKPLAVRLALLIAISVVIAVLDHRLDLLRLARATSATLTAPVHLLVSMPQEMIDWVRQRFYAHQQLRDENQALRDENVFLKIKLQKYNQLIFDNQRLKKILAIPFIPDHLSYSIATIIGAQSVKNKKTNHRQ